MAKSPQFWSYQVIRSFIRSNTFKRAEEVLRESMNDFCNSHEIVWPGIEVCKLRTGRNGPKKSTNNTDFTIATAPTSLVMSMIHTFITRKKRHRPDRNHALQALNSFLRFASSRAGNYTSRTRRFGDNCDCLFSCDGAILIPADVVWTSQSSTAMFQQCGPNGSKICSSPG